MNAGKQHAIKRLYEFGAFQLDPAERVFACHGKRVRLAPKAFDTLVILVQNSGRVVRKDDLVRSLWPDSFVEENNLNQHISALRRVLETEPGEYIETVPKLGYRFTCPVQEIGEHFPSPFENDQVLVRRSRTHIVLREEIEEEEDGPPEGGPRTRTTRESIETAAATGPAERFKRRLAVSIGFVIVIVTGTALFLESRFRLAAEHETPATSSPTRAGAAHKSVAVLGFRNLSQHTEDAWLSGALTEMLTTELNSGTQLRVVSGEEIQRMKSDMGLQDGQSLAKQTLAQIRNRVGADIVVSGSYTEVGSGPQTQIRLDLRLQDSVSAEEVLSTAVTGKVEELFSVVSRSGSALRARLGAAELTDTEGAQVQAALPSTSKAARLYSQGVARLRAFDAPQAERLLANAVAADPNFVLGHSALASAWSALGYDEKAQAEARRALDLSADLSRQEHLLIAGQYSELGRDWDQAVSSYQELAALFPDNVDYGLRLLGAQISSGKGHDALATVEKLRSLAPPLNHDPRIDIAQAEAEDSVGDFMHELDSANRAIRNGTELGERLLVARAWTKKSWALRRLGQTGEAITGLLEAKRIFTEAGDPQGVGSAMRLIGGTQQERGDYTKAEASFKEAIAIFRRIGDRRDLAMSINGLAIGYYERNDLRTARALDEQYLEIEQEVGSKINTAGALGNIANVEEAEGNLTEARHLNEESIKIFTEVGDQRALGTALGNLANEMYEQGDLAGAKAKLNEALAIKRKIGYQRGIAYDLAGLSDVLRAEGDLVGARQKQEEALAIRIQIGETQNAAVSRLELANLDIEEGRLADAERIAAETEREFEKEKSLADDVSAHEIEARSLLGQGKIFDAGAAIDRASVLAQGLSSLPLRFDIAVTSARVAMARRSGAIQSTRRDLESALALARKGGFREYSFKLEMTLDEVELQLGNSHNGRVGLQALANEARESGFLLVARDAESILSAQPTRRSRRDSTATR